MTGLLILGVYLLGWAPASAVVARAMAAEFDDEVGAMEAVLGAMVGLFWPLFGFPAVVWWLARRETPIARRDRIAVERDSRVREQARTIARLEREAGIR